MIKQLDLVNVCGHTARYTFGARKHLIKGPNEAGKSSISKAIAFNMMGVDTDGSKNPDHLISVGTDGAEVTMSTGKATIKRTKRRGATSKIKILREGLPATDVSQTDMMNQIGLSLDVFMSCWLSGYFMKLKADAKLKVLGEIANIDRKALLTSLLPEGYQPPAIIKLNNPRIDAEAVAGLRRQEQNKKTAAESSLNTLIAQEGAALGMTEAEYNQALAQLAEVTALISNHELYERQATAYTNEVERRKESKKQTDELVESLKLAQDKLNTLNEQIPLLEHNIGLARQKKEQLKQQAAAIEAKRRKVELTVPTKPSAAVGECSACKQQVGEAHVNALLQFYNDGLNAYNNHCREVADANKLIDQELEPLRAAYKAADDEDINLTRELQTSQGTHKGIVDTVTDMSAKAKKAPAAQQPDLVPPTPPQGDLAVLKNTRDDLSGKTRAYQQILAQQAQNATQIASLKQTISELDNAIVRYSALEKTLLALPELETQQTLEKVSIPGLQLSLVEGDLIVADSKGVDYRSLSDGRKIKTDISLATAIRRAVGPKAPQLLFVDNADLMDSQLNIPDDVQVLIAQVDDSIDGVQVIEL